MVALGIRAEPTALHWAVVEGAPDQPILRACETVQCPRAFQEPAILAWLRKQIMALMDEHSIHVVGLRMSEPIARGAGRDSVKRRTRMEAIVMEATESAGRGLVSGALATIGRYLGSAHPKSYLAQHTVRGLDWSQFMTPDHTLAVDCNVRDSHITHSQYAALKTKDAICDRQSDANQLPEPQRDVCDPGL